MGMARYLYMTSDGMVLGPFWLSQMRDLFKGGRIHSSTEVCMEGTRRWEGLQFYPEIYEENPQLPVLAKLRRSRSHPGRLTLWLILLGLGLCLLVLQWMN